MKQLKYNLEKPTLIWLVVSLLLFAVFWFGQARGAAPSASESNVISITKEFSESNFLPKISLVKELGDWGHVGYYVLMGRVFRYVSGDLEKVRTGQFIISLAALFVFTLIGLIFTARNRLSPIWVSLSLLILAVNPNFWKAATQLDYMIPFLLFSFLAMYFFERDWVGWAAICLSISILIDWHGLILSIAFVIARILLAESRVLRVERLLSFALPFVVAGLLLMAWKGVVPRGEIAEKWDKFRNELPLVRLDSLSYSLALIPIYALGFSWSWILRARTKALSIGGILTAVCIPLFFVFPIRFDYLEALISGAQMPLGFLDELVVLAAGEYKNLLLFFPWLVGLFIFIQIFFMDVLDHSIWLRFGIIFYFLIQPFILGVGDRSFLIVLPMILLFTLSEALVGDQGKLN